MKGRLNERRCKNREQEGHRPREGVPSIRHFTHIILFKSHSNPIKIGSIFPCFINEVTEAKKGYLFYSRSFSLWGSNLAVCNSKFRNPGNSWNSWRWTTLSRWLPYPWPWDRNARDGPQIQNWRVIIRRRIQCLISEGKSMQWWG